MLRWEGVEVVRVPHACGDEPTESRLARRLTTILPAMTLPAVMATARLPRLASRTGARTTLVTTRPCHAPPHTIAEVGLLGGGSLPRLGEGSRAHHGILFLDARPKCRRHVLEVLHQPLEESVIWIKFRGRPGSQHFCRVSRTGGGREGCGQRMIAIHRHRAGHHASSVSPPPRSRLCSRLVLFA